ncbi:MAG TPA: hypothetical protein VKR81_03945, partial [Candidatus Binatia bacterium]|nr:hypothetical protein [Candidatus Binatia bacterium]
MEEAAAGGLPIFRCSALTSARILSSESLQIRASDDNRAIVFKAPLGDQFRGGFSDAFPVGPEGR